MRNVIPCLTNLNTYGILFARMGKPSKNITLRRKVKKNIYAILDNYVEFTLTGLPKGPTIHEYHERCSTCPEPPALIYYSSVGQALQSVEKRDPKAVRDVLDRWYWRDRFDWLKNEVNDNVRQRKCCYQYCSKPQELAYEFELLVKDKQEAFDTYRAIERRDSFSRGLVEIEDELQQRGLVQ